MHAKVKNAQLTSMLQNAQEQQAALVQTLAAEQALHAGSIQKRLSETATTTENVVEKKDEEKSTQNFFHDFSKRISKPNQHQTAFILTDFLYSLVIFNIFFKGNSCGNLFTVFFADKFCFQFVRVCFEASVFSSFIKNMHCNI